MGLPSALNLSGRLGAILIFIGFVRATTPMKGAEETPEVIS